MLLTAIGIALSGVMMQERVSVEQESEVVAAHLRRLFRQCQKVAVTTVREMSSTLTYDTLEEEWGLAVGPLMKKTREFMVVRGEWWRYATSWSGDYGVDIRAFDGEVLTMHDTTATNYTVADRESAYKIVKGKTFYCGYLGALGVRMPNHPLELGLAFVGSLVEDLRNWVVEPRIGHKDRVWAEKGARITVCVCRPKQRRLCAYFSIEGKGTQEEDVRYYGWEVKEREAITRRVYFLQWNESHGLPTEVVDETYQVKPGGKVSDSPVVKARYSVVAVETAEEKVPGSRQYFRIPKKPGFVVLDGRRWGAETSVDGYFTYVEPESKGVVWENFQMGAQFGDRGGWKTWPTALLAVGVVLLVVTVYGMSRK